MGYPLVLALASEFVSEREKKGFEDWMRNPIQIQIQIGRRCLQLSIFDSLRSSRVHVHDVDPLMNFLILLDVIVDDCEARGSTASERSYSA